MPVTFVALSLSLTVLGALGPRGFKTAVLILLCAPFSNAFASEIYVLGLYPYDFYFLALLVRESCAATIQGRLPYLGYAPLTLLVVPFGYALFSIVEQDVTLYFLRDFRPFLYSLYIITLIIFIRRHGLPFGERTIEYMIALAGLSNVAWFLMIWFGVLEFQDEYYLTNTYRYADLSTYASLVYLIFGYKRRHLLSAVASALSVASVLLSGYRVMIALLILLWLTRSRSLHSALLRVMVCAAALTIYLTFLAEVDSSRLDRAATVGGMFIQLSTRFSPFFSLFNEAELHSFLTGFGHGQTFQIPWFAYRQNVDTTNNFVDSMYLTFYAKYGVFAFIYVYFSFRALDSLFNPGSVRDSLAFYVFLASLATFYCLPFQGTAPGLLVGFSLITRLSENTALQRPARL